MLTGIRACVFDAYGTLFDFASAAAGCSDVLGEKAGPLTALWREKQLQYSWLRGLQGRYVSFWEVTGDALDFALETLGLPADGPLRERLMDLYRTLGTFPEVASVLHALREAGFATAILSNGSPDMLASAVEGWREPSHDRMGAYLLAISKKYEQPVDILGVGVHQPPPNPAPPPSAS